MKPHRHSRAIPGHYIPVALHYRGIVARCGVSVSDASGPSNRVAVTVHVNPGPPSQGIVAGFDRESFPGTTIMADLIDGTNLEWCGYYLSGPSQRIDTGWLGQRSYLESSGWKVAPLYVGQQDPKYNGGDLSYAPSSSQGVTDGNEAAAEMGPDTGAKQTVFGWDAATQKHDVPRSVTRGQGFALGTTVYLDWEAESIAAGKNDNTDYIIAWCKTVATNGYQPGVYCPATDVNAIANALAEAGIIVNFWVTKPIQPMIPSTTTHFSTQDPTKAQAQATSWQYAIEPQFDTTKYSIQTKDGNLTNVDLDTSSLYGSPSYFLVDPKNLQVDNNAGSRTCSVGTLGEAYPASITWSAFVAEGDGWLTVSKESGIAGSAIMNVTYDANTQTSDRVGRIVVMASGIAGSPILVTVTQAAGGGNANGDGGTGRTVPGNGGCGQHGGTAGFPILGAVSVLCLAVTKRFTHR